MTRTEARKARERQRRIQFAVWSILIFCELLVASVPATITAEVLVPLGRAARGYEAFGIERLIVAAVFCIAYTLVHKYACDKILGRDRK